MEEDKVMWVTHRATAQERPDLHRNGTIRAFLRWEVFEEHGRGAGDGDGTLQEGKETGFRAGGRGDGDISFADPACVGCHGSVLLTHSSKRNLEGLHAVPLNEAPRGRETQLLISRRV